eukprot:360194-Chlamydomonas_euryale.AAC.7
MHCCTGSCHCTLGCERMQSAPWMVHVCGTAGSPCGCAAAYEQLAGGCCPCASDRRSHTHVTHRARGSSH